MEYVNKAANVIIEEALSFMANKAGKTIDEVISLIANDQNAAKYFAELVKIGIDAASEV